MKLVSFSAKNYRSITEAYKLPLGNLSVLVGPNNEGKSNILKAIVSALSLLSQAELLLSDKIVRYRYVRGFRQAGDSDFDWPRDFPVALQATLPNGRSEFVLEFSLTAEERARISAETGTNLTTNLKLKLGMGPEDARVDVLLQGKGKKYLAQHLKFMAKFVADRIDVQYVPAIRPSEMAIDVVENLLSKELAILEGNAQYKKALAELEAQQRPVLERLGLELTKTVASFVPEVKAITITHGQLRRAIRRSCTVTVDDGTLTDLDLKGDGVKSLTAISLVRHTSQKALAGRQLILAIEEPESHLHPRAAHRLREVIQDIAATHQVILTTHSPIMVNRESVGTNIIVKDSRATPARQLRDIRDALGVEIGDNLTTANLVLLVEGAGDAAVVGAWIRQASEVVRAAVTSGSLVIDSLAGASNLRYKLSLYRGLVCNVHVFVDNDESGRMAIQEAMSAKLLTHAEYTEAVAHGLSNSELEDLIGPGTYEAALKAEFGIVLIPKFMTHSKKAWTERMAHNCAEQGKAWTKQLEKEIKAVVSKTAASAGWASLIPARRGPIDGVVAALESRLAKQTP